MHCETKTTVVVMQTSVVNFDAVIGAVMALTNTDLTWALLHSMLG